MSYPEPPSQPPQQGWSNPWGQPAVPPNGSTSPSAGPTAPAVHAPPPPWAGAAEFKPGPIPLRPLSMSELLDGAITVVRTHPKATFGLSAVLALIGLVVVGLPLATLARWGLSFVPSSTDTADPDSLGLNWADISSALLLSLPAWICGLLATGILTALVGQAVLGRTVGAAQSWQAAKPRLWALLGLSLLQVLVSTLAIAVALTPLGVGLIIGQPALALLSLPLGVVAIVALIGLSCVFALAPPVVVLEQRGPLSALKRTVRLLRGQWWRTFGIWLLLQVLLQVLGSVVSVPLGIVSTVMQLLRDTGSSMKGLFSFISDLFTALGSSLSAVVIWPFAAAAMALLYLDMRMRREGLDLVLDRVARAEPDAPADPYVVTDSSL